LATEVKTQIKKGEYLVPTVPDFESEEADHEAHNLFSAVDDFRAFILSTHSAPDVLVTLKLRCIKAERLDCDQGTCVTLIDAALRVVLEPMLKVLTRHPDVFKVGSGSRNLNLELL
jgi:hypothetical protein